MANVERSTFCEATLNRSGHVFEKTPSSPNRQRRGSARARALLLIAGAAVLGGCRDEAAAREKPVEKVPVTAASVLQQPVPIELDSVGTVEPLSTVDITPQVTGTITFVHFKEGDSVKKGDLLFSIDTRPYATGLAAAQAQLTKDEALASQAREEAQRQERLVAEGVGTAQELSRARANANSSSAALEADRAQIRSASLNVQFTKLRSPIDGRTGSLFVHAGNVVTANSNTPLVTIRTLVPIHVRFAVPETYLSQIRERRTSSDVVVRATPRGPAAKTVSGRLVFIDNSVDATTGTIALKALFTNEDQSLWPGQFVDVALELGVEDKALVVPLSAVMPGQEGSHVYVVEGDHVRLRTVQVERQHGNDAILKSGVAAGERVVTDGQVRLRDKTPITIKEGAAAPPPNRPSGAPPVRG